LAITGDSVRAVVSRNTSFAFGRQLLCGIVFLCVTPYAISKLGIERYGVWALTSALLGYAALGDLGVRTAFKKYVAEYHAVGARDRILAIAGDGLVYYSVLGIVPAVLAVLFREPVLRALNVGADILPEAEPLLLLMTAVFFLDSLTNVFCGMVEGMQRMEVSNSIYVAQSVVLGLGTVVALWTGRGLVGMGFAAVTASAVATASMYVAAQRVTGMRLSPWDLRLSRQVFKELFVYGVKLQGSAVAMLGNLHLDKLLLARFWGLEHVAVYEIALRGALVFRQAPALVVSALVPAVSELKAKEEIILLRRVYERGVRYIAAAAVPLTVVALVYADDLIAVWIGSPSFSVAGQLLRLLAFAHCMAIVVDAPFSVARGLGALRYELTTGVVHPLAHLALGLLLVPPFGLWGAGLAHSGVVILTALAAAYWAHVGLGLSSESFRRFYAGAVTGPVLASLVAAACSLLAYVSASVLLGLSHVVPWWTGSGSAGLVDRLGVAAALGTGGAVFASVYAVLLFRLRAVSARDLSHLPVVGRVFSTRLGTWLAGGERVQVAPTPREARW